MLKPLIAGITALSLSLATPVQAGGLDREEVGKLLIGLAAIAALNAALENRRDNRRNDQAAPVHDRDMRAPRVTPNHNDWAGLSRQTSRRVLPSACLQNIETRFGTQRMFGRRCLERNYDHASSLPERCAVQVYTNDGPRRGFDPFCLRDQGYRSDRRH